MADFGACALMLARSRPGVHSSCGNIERGQISIDVQELYEHWTELSEHSDESLRRDTRLREPNPVCGAHFVTFQFELLRNAWGRRRVRRHTGKHLLDVCLRQVAGQTR